MRWPAILALAAALAALVVADRLAPEVDDAAPAADAGLVRSGFSSTGGSTWFCVGGVGGTGGSRQDVVVVNTSGDELRGSVRFFPAVPLGGQSQQWPPTRVDVIVGPYARLAIDPAATAAQFAAELANFAEVFVAAEVRLDGAGGLVTQEVALGDASDVSPCTTSASSVWHFATASTRRDARVRLSLLNPFSDNAVVDLAFVTDEGRRAPVAYQGLVVPANALAVLDLGSEVTRREQVSVSVEARSGNLVASALQSFNGDLGLSGVSLRTGAPQAAEQWLFPLGVAGADTGAANSFVVFNPGTAEARVDLSVELDASLRARGVPPFELTVPPGQRVEVAFFPPLAGEAHPTSGIDVVAATTRILPSERYWVSVRSFNEVAVVAERLRTSEADLPVEVSILAGRIAGSARGVLPLPRSGGPPSIVALVNPSLETISRLSLEVLTAEGWSPLAGLEDLEIRPRQRLVLDVSNRLRPEVLALRFEASEPLVASYAGPAGIRAAEAVPELESLSELEHLLF
ncbi:MAG: hypothetical protein J4F99_05690 [Acidimicrobiia bacterium]|nr:hypothetical protein [Acidimicrobiia bacterium]